MVEKKMTSKEKVGISLGWNCGSASGGVSLGLRKTREEGYKTCPFDLCNSNLAGIIKCLEENFSHFCDSNYLKLVDIPLTEKYHAGDTLLVNTRYGFIFNHESPGHANIYLHQNWEGGKEHFIKNDFLEFKKRYSSRIDNFFNYLKSNNKIIFLVNYPHDDFSDLDTCIRKTYPDLSFVIQNTNKKKEHKDRFDLIGKQMISNVKV